MVSGSERSGLSGRAILTCGAVLAIASGLGLASAERVEWPWPAGLAVGLDQPLRTDRHEFRTIAELVGEDPLAGTLTLELDVLARYLNPENRRAREGSYLPHLEGGVEVGGELLDARREPLQFRMTSRGPSYGATLRVPAQTGRLRVEVALSTREGDRTFRYVTAFAPSELSRSPEAGGGGGAADDGVDAPADDLRVNVLGQLDARGSDDYSDVWGYTDGSVYLAIIGYDHGTLFIDVTDPTNPVEVEEIGGPTSSWRDIKTYLHYAYISTEGSGNGEGLQIVDLSDPLNPTLVNTYASTFTTCHNVYIDTDIGELWAVGTDNDTRILDLTQDPVNPVEVGSFTARYVHDAYVKDGFGYMSEINSGRQEILDTTDPSNLQVLSGWSTPDNAAHNCWANDDHSLLVTTDETTGGHLAVYDITEKNNPGVLLSEYEPNPIAIVHNAYFDDDFNDRVAISHYSLGFKFVDLFDPELPFVLGSYDTYPAGEGGFNGAWGVYPFDPRGYHYVSDIQTGLYVLAYAPTGGVLRGVVRDGPGGTPVPDARIVALPGAESTVSAADGAFALYVPEGDVQLRVSAWGFRSRVVDAGSMALDGQLALDVELASLPRVGLSGTITSSADGSPVADATVSIDGSPLATTSAADGSYTFLAVAAGQVTLAVEAFGFASGEGRIVLPTNQAGVLDLALEPARFADDVESNQGWTIGMPGDDATSGEWERVDPNGTGGGSVQPEDDSTPAPGVTAFITGQSNPGAGTESNDVENGSTNLVTPTIDASGLGAAMVRYRRWVSEDAGFFGGGTFRAFVSDNGGATWVNAESISDTENFWRRRAFNLGSLVGLTTQLQVRFEADGVSTQFPQFATLEAGVDDFDLVRACRTLFNPTAGDGDADGIVDACDSCGADSGNDIDGDGLCADADNSTRAGNPGQADADGDGVGDASDNCLDTVNVAQRDLDRDGIGDACDLDMDGDQIDDAGDPDDDNDGIADGGDLCPTVPDAAQPDRDTDGQGDACDDDDGVVQGVRVAGDRISWEAESGSDAYNLYRGDLGAPALVRLAACRIGSVPITEAYDTDLPVIGDGFFYLVARVDGGVEGPLASRSDGTPRTIDSPCP